MVHPKPDLGGVTSRSIVLDLIRSRGPISRVQLATISGFTQATISTVVRQLTQDGLVVESGQREYTGGKPRVMITLNPRARYALGIQLGIDSTTYVVTDVMGDVIGRVRAPGLRDDPPETVVPVLVARAEDLLETLAIPRAEVVGVGVAAPGPLDLERGSIEGDEPDAWSGYPLRAAVEQGIGLPTVLDNDATAASVGEFWGGRRSDSTAHCTVYMGAGIGAGIAIGGSVYRGASSNTGEIGRMRFVTGTGEPRQTLEELAAPRAVSIAARDSIAHGRSTAISLGDEGDPFEDFTRVATAAAHGDALANELIGASADLLSEAVLSLADILDLDSIALAGPAFAIAGPIYLMSVQNKLAANRGARRLHRIDVNLSHHVVDAAAVGAATIVLQRELAPRSISAPSFALD